MVAMKTTSAAALKAVEAELVWSSPKVSAQKTVRKLPKTPFPGFIFILHTESLLYKNNPTLWACVENNQQQLFDITAIKGNSTSGG